MLSSASVALVVPAVVVFAMGYDNGGYSLPSRSFWAIAVWWAVILGVALGGVRSRAIGRSALAVGGLLSAFGLVTLLSASWGSSAERAINEFNRVSLYLGVFVLAVLFSSRAPRVRACDGLALGICGVVAVALTSRFAVDTFSDRGAAEVLPTAVTRLSFPVGYWNGLAILAALAVPLLLRLAAAPGVTLVRALAVAPLPAIAVAMYLASSRGGYATALIGAAAFLLLSRERWWPAAALLVGGAGSALAVGMVAQQSAFVNSPTSSLGRDQSATALVWLVLACLAVTGAYAGLVAALRGRRTPSRRAGIAVAAITVGLLLVAIAASDPIARFREFKRPPGEATVVTDDFVRSHLLSAGGSGRWQFWETGIDAFRAEPLLGHGAGAFEAWWAERGSLALFVRDAHSLYVETLAEVGAFGLLLLVAAFSIGLLTAVTRIRRLPPDHGRNLAAPTAVFVAFLAAAAIDWVWELTAVSLVGVACLGLMVAPLPEPVIATRRVALRPALVVAGLTAAWLAVCIQAIPYLGELRIRASRDAVARGDLDSALEAAESARAIQPWAASPWLQVALVREELGDLRAGRIGDRTCADSRLVRLAALARQREGSDEAR